MCNRAHYGPLKQWGLLIQQKSVTSQNTKTFNNTGVKTWDHTINVYFTGSKTLNSTHNTWHTATPVTTNVTSFSWKWCILMCIVQMTADLSPTSLPYGPQTVYILCTGTRCNKTLAHTTGKAHTHKALLFIFLTD